MILDRLLPTFLHDDRNTEMARESVKAVQSRAPAENDTWSVVATTGSNDSNTEEHNTFLVIDVNNNDNNDIQTSHSWSYALQRWLEQPIPEDTWNALEFETISGVAISETDPNENPPQDDGCLDSLSSTTDGTRNGPNSIQDWLEQLPSEEPWNNLMKQD